MQSIKVSELTSQWVIVRSFSNKCVSRSKVNAQHLSTTDYQGHMFVCLFVCL